MTAIVMDTTPLGLLTHPRNPPHAAACRQWLSDLIATGRRILIPEIADFEIRRELLLNNNVRSIALLDQLCSQSEYVPITTLAMRIAAGMWADARKAGLPTSANQRLEGDVILAAQAMAMNIAFIVATANPAHLSRFVPSELWSNIVP